MPYTECKKCVFLFEETPATFECRRKSPHVVYRDHESRAVGGGVRGAFFPATELDRGCGDGEPKDPVPTQSELDRSWKQGFTEGEAMGLRKARGIGATCR